MKTIYTKIIFLLLVVLACACNKDEDTTIVIEDGQPKASTLIVGKWKPAKKQLIDKLTGNIIKEEPLEEEETFPWEFFGDGTFGKGEGSGNRFNWNVDDDNYTLSFGDDEWSIGKLTKAQMILYLLSKKGSKPEKENSWLAYLFDRIGEYEGEEEPDEPATNDCLYKPYDGPLVTKIVETTKDPAFQYQSVSTYQYDQYNRIIKFSYGNDEATPFWSWEYKYDKDKVTASLGDNFTFIGHLNKDGYIGAVEDAREGKEITWYDYDDKGYLYAGKTMNDYISIKYDNNRNATQIHYPYVSDNWIYTYEKDEDNLKNNLDLNKVCMLMGHRLDATRSDMDGVFGQFGFLGKRSPGIVSEEVNDSHFGSAFTHKLVNNRVTQIQRICGNTIYTYDIYYK